MTDKEFREQKRRVNKYLDKWQKPAGFGWWYITVEYERDRYTDEPNTAAHCWSQWQYHQATIRFYLPALKSLEDEELERTIIHELCHLLISPLEDYSTPERRQITEHTTSLVADALYWAYSNVGKESREQRIKVHHEIQEG